MGAIISGGVDIRHGFDYISRMIVTYLKHSGFVVEAVNCTIVIDAVKGNLPEMRDDKPVYVLVSHPKSEYYSPKIFELSDQYKDVYYFLSYDVSTKQIPATVMKVVTFIHPGQQYKLARFLLSVHSGSDGGVSFSMQVGYDMVFHAGNLNDWQFPDASVEANKTMHRQYLKTVEELEKHYDVAFLPCDPKLGPHMCDGIKEFLEHATVDSIVPMHFWDDYTAIPLASKQLGRELVTITKKEKQFEL